LTLYQKEVGIVLRDGELYLYSVLFFISNLFRCGDD